VNGRRSIEIHAQIDVIPPQHVEPRVIEQRPIGLACERRRETRVQTTSSARQPISMARSMSTVNRARASRKRSSRYGCWSNAAV
jgi:hypothetical protein